jgi:hypothetical protein
MFALGQKQTSHHGRKSTVVRCCPKADIECGLINVRYWRYSGHANDLSRYLLMILRRHDAIAGLGLKYAQIRWVMWKYYALRGESLFCSYSPFANAIKCDWVRLGTLSEH